MTANLLESVDLFRLPTDWVDVCLIEKCVHEDELMKATHMLCHEFVDEFYDQEAMDGHLLNVAFFDSEPPSGQNNEYVVVKVVDMYPGTRVTGVDKEGHVINEERYMYGDMYFLLDSIGFHRYGTIYATMSLVGGARADAAFAKYASFNPF
jgi:hypothetical protein